MPFWAPPTRKRYHKQHRPQRLSEYNDPPQHAKGKTDVCPGPRNEAATRRNVTQGGGGGAVLMLSSFAHGGPK